jgi:heptosyltransferase-2
MSPIKTPITEKYVVILLGSNRKTNKLNLESWVKIVNNLASKNVYIIGGESERIFSESLILSTNHPHLYNLVGELKLSESVFVVSKAELIISHDTGLMHFASALNKDMVVYFSSRDIRGRWYPSNINAVVYRSVVSCGFCLKSTCPYSNECINNLV